MSYQWKEFHIASTGKQIGQYFEHILKKKKENNLYTIRTFVNPVLFWCKKWPRVTGKKRKKQENEKLKVKTVYSIYTRSTASAEGHFECRQRSTERGSQRLTDHTLQRPSHCIIRLSTNKVNTRWWGRSLSLAKSWAQPHEINQICKTSGTRNQMLIC